MSVTHAGPTETQNAPFPYAQALTGQLTQRRWLKKPVLVVIDYADGEYIVSEPQFHTHGVGDSVDAALTDFRSIFAESLDVLREEEGNLSAGLQRELAFLRDVIAE